MGLPENPNIFANNPLDRASYRRTDDAWIAEQLAAPTSLFVPMWRLQPFVLPEAGPGEGKDIGWMRTGLLKEL
ncbi:MAG: NADH pyrophosphatase, partial [Parvibaculum sp.]